MVFAILVAVVALCFSGLAAYLGVFLGIHLHIDNQPGYSDNAPAAAIGFGLFVVMFIEVVALAALLLVSKVAKGAAVRQLRIVAAVCVAIVIAGLGVGYGISLDTGCFRTCAPFPN